MIYGPDEKPMPLAEALTELIGKQLASVEFVQDYVQLHFDGPTLSAYTWPTLKTRSATTLAWGGPGYRDALCGEIGSIVCRAEIGPEGLILEFSSGAMVAISLKDTDYRGPEALEFSLSADRVWVA